MSRQLDWYYKNRDRALKNGKSYYKKNQENIKLKERERYYRNVERRCETSRLHYHANHIKRDAQIKEYKEKHPEIAYKANMKRIKIIATANMMDTETYIYASMSWKKMIKKNCGNKCIICGVSGQDIKLHAHHLIFKSTEPALALTESNGIMLCVPHHKELHKLNPIKQKRHYL